jgi:hypothetical protein
MEFTSIAVNAGVVAAIGLILGWMGKSRFESLERRIDALEKRMDGFQASLDAMRSDLTQVALAVGARPEARNA